MLRTLVFRIYPEVDFIKEFLNGVNGMKKLRQCHSVYMKIFNASSASATEDERNDGFGFDIRSDMTCVHA